MDRSRTWGKQGSWQGKESGKGATDLPRPPSEHPTASALPVSLLVAWIVARLRKRNFKKLQGQNCQSIKSEKFVEGVEGKPEAGHGDEKEDLTQGDSPFFHLSSLRKGLLAAGQGEGLQGHWVEVGPGVLPPL